MENKIESRALRGRKNEENPDLKGDYRNFVILLLLYVLQGVPVGVSSSMTVLLQDRGASYKDQTIFSIAVYPFMLKILWAPIVDCFYSKTFGRRKSWLIPAQILIGSSLLFLSTKIDEWMGDGESQKPRVVLITVVFFLIWFLTATQDIVVDGWAVTMLKRRNVGYAATANFIGQSFGSLLGHIVFLSLESKEFCNKYIFSEPRDEGLIKLSGFLRFWGFAFLAITIGVAIFKREPSVDDELNKNRGIKKAYPTLWKIFKLKPMLRLSTILATEDFGFAACELISTLKLMDYGIPKEAIALYNVPTFIVQLFIPILIGKYTAGKYPLIFYLKAFPYRLIFSVVVVGLVYFTPTLIGNFADIPVHYTISVLILFFMHQTAMRCMFVSSMGFFAKISDPSMAGTYMTLYDVIYLGGKLFYTFSLWLVDILTWKSCVFDVTLLNSKSFIPENDCSNEKLIDECTENGGKCEIIVDGYYFEAVINTMFGIFWYIYTRRYATKMQELPLEAWHVNPVNIKDENEDFPLRNH